MHGQPNSLLIFFLEELWMGFIVVRFAIGILLQKHFYIEMLLSTFCKLSGT